MSKHYSPVILVLLIFAGILLNNSLLKADYCEPKYSNAGIYMGIDYVQIGNMENSSDWASSGYTYYSNKVVDMKPGDEIEFFVEFGYTYEMELAIWVDWNGDDKFDTKTELAYGTYDGLSWEGYKGSFVVPDDVSFGTTRMRVMTEYSYMNYPYQYPADPCGTSYYYGEAEDYVVNIAPNAPDASITALTNPMNLFRVGNHDINVTLSSNNKAPLESVYIDWWINDVKQETYFWKGKLGENQTTSINLANVNLDYPANGPFNAFNMRFQVRNANDFEVDANPDNDVYTVNRTPVLNDAGVVGFFGPPEGFGPGITQVRARVRNYTPKPLTSVTVHWKIDGVDQSPVTFTGINIGRDETQDLNLGTYNFYAKTPLGPFTVDCSTSNPNGVNDEDKNNDEYKGGIGPSLAAGTYTIGGATAHFASPGEAASYINSSGIFGEGKVTFLINSGIYNGQIVLNSPLPRRNPIEFRGNSMFASDVVISFAPTAQNNFVILLNGMDRISFNNLTINNNSSNTSNGGILVNAMSVWGLDFNKVNFNGVANSPRFNNNYSIINMMNTSDVKVSECTFNNGSAGIYSLVTNKIYPNIEISKNDFFNFSWVGIYSQILESALPSGDVKFADNRFISNAGLVPNFGIQSWNSTSILRNEFSGITGSGNTGDAVIYVSHNTQNPNEAAEIVGNRVNGTNLNGIFVNGANTFINQNYVNIGQSGNLNIAAMRIINASGAAGNNQITGRNSTALDIAGSPNFDFVYNSVVNESNTLPTAKLNNANRVWRNIFANNGTGVVYHVNGISSSNENIFHTNGNILINDNGSQYANLNPWQAKGFDRESDVALIEFESLENLNIKYYSTSLLAGYQLFTGDEGYLGQLELFDFGNVVRRSYFVGSHELLLAITIERQTDGFVDCVGSTDNYLTVSSAIDYNAPMTYQWELDGSPIHGETEPILYFTNLRHNQAGIYKCLVMGPGATTPVYSREVAVYVTRPTDITTQPQDVFAFTGETVVLSFEAHANGKSIENAIANDEVKVNWYKYVSEANDILLTDNHKIAGSKSNYLTIRNFGTVDQGEYYAVIQGLCGTVETDKAELLEAVIDLNITQTPSSTVICEGNNASFIIAANTSSNYEITYEWMKDGTPLQNIAGKVDGANTNALNIMNCEAADAGNYSVLVTLVGGGLSETRFADLTVNKGPAILLQPQDAVVEAGRQLMLDVVAEGNDDQEVLNYKWFHNGTLVQDSDDMYYIVDVTTPDNAGEYYVVVSNNCGDVTSETVTVTITTGTSSVVEVFQSGYSLTTATPNPVQSVATISFTVPTESFVKITMTDASGAGSIILAEGNYQTGTHNINFNAQDYNLASGTYFYYLESNGVRLAQKLVVIK